MTGAARYPDYHGTLQAVAYIEKPVDFPQLLSLIEQHCRACPA
jgi:hypothetical protein